jgi:hypothetical protein
VALDLKSNIVLLGENGTRLAEKILDETAKGRGFSLPLNLQLKDERYGDVIFGLPMREILAKQSALYAHILKLETFFLPTFITKKRSKQSITSLTASLVARLQADFPSTASTVVRTGLKVELSPLVLKGEEMVGEAEVDLARKEGGLDGAERKKWGGRRKKDEDKPLPKNLILCPLCSG